MCFSSASSSINVTGATVSRGRESKASLNRLGTNFGVSTSSNAPSSAVLARDPVTSAPTLLPMTLTSFSSNMRSKPSGSSPSLDEFRQSDPLPKPRLLFQPSGISTNATRIHCDSDPTLALASSHRRSTLNSYVAPGCKTTGG